MGTPGHPSRRSARTPPASKHRYQFTVQLDGTAGNAYQGDTSSVQFDWNAA